MSKGPSKVGKIRRKSEMIEEENNTLPNGCFRVGNNLFGKCEACSNIVRINKPVFGSLHLCIPNILYEEDDEE